jgi:hypothetical protein
MNTINGGENNYKKMKNLIIHPDDRTTDFLKPIYDTLPNTTIITGGITKSRVEYEIIRHERIIMLGHGTQYGLISMGKFKKTGQYIINSTTTHLLKNKECIFIWCNADIFVKTYNLKGIYSGMFISEMIEADSYGFNTKQSIIDKSNNSFAKILGEQILINNNIEIIFNNANQCYKELAQVNEIANFNQNRFYLTS